MNKRSERFCIADGMPHPSDWSGCRIWFRLTDFEDEQWRRQHVYNVGTWLTRVDTATLRQVAELIGYKEE